MRAIDRLLEEYGSSHRNHVNKAIHWVCVPLIFFSVVGFLYCVNLPFRLMGATPNLAMIALLALTVYYMRLSPTLWFGMLIFALLCLVVCRLVVMAHLSLWLVCLIIFAGAWIGQFYGHHVEGKKPSFLKDLQFLLIGPAWLMSFIYRRIGLRI